MKIALIVDPLEALKPAKDTSIAMMRAARSRGHAVFAIQRADLSWRDGAVRARACALEVRDQDDPWYSAAAATDHALTDFDCVLMRQDPPFDLEYVAATWLLERAEAQGARVFNAPRALRDHSEKLAVLEFPEFTPPTIVARAARDLHAFIDQVGDAVLKPIDGMGGAGVFRVRHDDPNRNVIVEMLTHDGTRTIIGQRFLPAIAEGDKRILLIGGEVVPYVLARIPRAGETRGNLATGGHGVVRQLTARDRQIGEHLAPILHQRGILFAGIDVIGDCLTEINVTSPTCFVEITQASGFDVAGRFLEALEAAVAEGSARK